MSTSTQTPSRKRHNHRKAGCEETRTSGLEGGCSEKARIHFEGTRDLAGQPTLPEGFGLSQENLDGQHPGGPGGQGGDSLGSAHRASSFHLAVARRSNSSVSRWYRSVSAVMASRTRARSARNA